MFFLGVVAGAALAHYQLYRLLTDKNNALAACHKRVLGLEELTDAVRRDRDARIRELEVMCDRLRAGAVLVPPPAIMPPVEPVRKDPLPAPVESWLAGFEDPEMAAEFREEAEQLLVAFPLEGPEAIIARLSAPR